jgi:hypothetical protein
LIENSCSIVKCLGKTALVPAPFIFDFASVPRIFLQVISPTGVFPGLSNINIRQAVRDNPTLNRPMLDYNFEKAYKHYDDQDCIILQFLVEQQ